MLGVVSLCPCPFPKNAVLFGLVFRWLMTNHSIQHFQHIIPIFSTAEFFLPMPVFLPRQNDLNDDFPFQMKANNKTTQKIVCTDRTAPAAKRRRQYLAQTPISFSLYTCSTKKGRPSLCMLVRLSKAAVTLIDQISHLLVSYPPNRCVLYHLVFLPVTLSTIIE